MIEIEKREPCLTFLPRDKLRRMRCAMAQPETRSGENSYKRSSVKPCFKTVILGTQNLINAALEVFESFVRSNVGYCAYVVFFYFFLVHLAS